MTQSIEQEVEGEHIRAYLNKIKSRSDALMDYFLASYFLIGLGLSFYYDTWIIGIGVGGLSLLAYYSAKFLSPNTSLYRYVLSTVFGIFMAQFIYQMHGLFEMHFFAFIGSAILITYQDWKLQIPLALVVVVHHAIFGYLQYIGYTEIYFTQLDYMTLETFIIHGVVSTSVFFLCGLWARNFKDYSYTYIRQSFKIGQLQEADEQKEAFIRDRKAAEQQLLELLSITNGQNKQLQNFAHIVSHNIRSHSANINGLVNIFGDPQDQDEHGKLYEMLKKSSDKLEETIENLNHIITIQNTEQTRSRMNLHQEIDKSCDAINSLIMNSQATIVNQVDENVFVSVVPSYLESVLLNLLTNAIKYKSEDRNPIITFYSRFQLGYTILYVQDNGLGIDLAKHGDSVFGMYKTFHRHKEAKGLGLFITRNQVEAMGGKIEISSALGQGSLFKVYFEREDVLELVPG